ncbi:MAG TPA: TonB-dependent receptor [Saprospiraceae bacterium]|nr:TonB-dependent receptor [Saprospiraceae bacterium]
MKQMLILLAAVFLFKPIQSQPNPQEPQSTIFTSSSAMSDTMVEEHVFMSFDTSHPLDEIVVSANRFEQERRNVPQVTEVITAKSLAFENLATSADVMQNTGNILVQKSQLGGGSPVIRGFETNKVLLVVDGIRMNNTIYRAGHLQNILTLDNAAMDKIEILYGPGSVMYGSDALGGVMNFYTKNPVFAPSGEQVSHANAFVRYATAADELTGHLDFSIAGSKFGSITSFTYSEFDDLIQGANRRDEYPDFGLRPWYVRHFNGTDTTIINPNPDEQVGSGYTQYDLLQKFVYKASDAVTHKINFQYSNSTDVPRYDRLTQTQNGNPRYGDWYYGPQKRLLAAYTMDIHRSSGLFGTGKITAAYQNIEESRHDRRYKNTTLNHRIEKLDIATLNADFNNLSGKSTWSYGLEGTYNHVNSTAITENIETGETGPLDTRYPDGGSDVGSIALYISDAYTVNTNFLLQGGVRAAYHTLTSKFVDKTFFPFPYDEAMQSNVAVTGSVGTVLQSDDGFRVSFMGASGYRAPSVDDMSKVFESVQGTLNVPNPDLGPEHTYNVDLTLSKRIADKHEIGIGGYYTWYRDAITLAPGTFNGESEIVYEGDTVQVYTNVNAKKAFIYGFNAFLSINFTNALSLYSTINYTYGRIETDTTPFPLDHIPPLFGKTALRYNAGKLNAEFSAIYQGWKDVEDYGGGEDNLPYATVDGMPSWMTLNLKASYAITDMLMVQAGVENIADTNYRVFSSNISAPGRNLFVTLRAAW